MNTPISLESVKAVVDQLSMADKIRLIEAILPEIKIELLKKETVKRPQFGCAKGAFKMSEDFDEPLDDFKDYMP
jgi:hypothetical protein